VRPACGGRLAMPTAVAVVACALALLGKSERKFPPIALVDVVPREVSAQAEAFVRPPDRTIYLVTTSLLFRAVQNSKEECGDYIALKKLASVLAHEEWHVLHGLDEKAAYEAQLTALIRVGVPPDSKMYISVVRSMQTVIEKQKQKQKQKPEMLLAARPRAQ
jgi:hypothetical protein